MNTPNIKVTGFIKHPTGRFTFSINGVRHWTDVRGWGLYTSKTQLVIHPVTKYRKVERVQVCVASAGEFRLPADAETAALVVAADLRQLLERRAVAAARRAEQGPDLADAAPAAVEVAPEIGDWVSI